MFGKPKNQMALRRHNNERKRHGQALIEMALVVTVLLFLTLGLIQYGLLANARLTLTNLAREGARYGAISWTNTNAEAISTSANYQNSIRDRIIRVAAATPLRDITDSNITISYPQGKTQGNPIRIDISYNMRNKFILPASFPGLSRFGTSTTATAMMVME